MTTTAHPGFDSAAALLKSHTHSGFSRADKTEGLYITISRESGARATTLANLLAQSLGEKTGHSWDIYGSNLIAELLEANHLSPKIAQFLPEGRISEANAIVGELVGLHPNLWELTQKAKDLMRNIARRGHAIFIGRGAAFATLGVPHGVRVRLVAAPDIRAKNVAARLGITEEAALAHNTKLDAERRAYIRRNFDADASDPHHYDLVINSGTMSMTAIVDFISQLVQAQIPAER